MAGLARASSPLSLVRRWVRWVAYIVSFGFSWWNLGCAGAAGFALLRLMLYMRVFDVPCWGLERAQELSEGVQSMADVWGKVRGLYLDGELEMPILVLPSSWPPR